MLNIGVFFGGTSVEHEISVISAVQAMKNIDLTKYNVIPVYITKEGEFYSGLQLWNIERYADLPKLLSECDQIAIVRIGKNVAGIRTKPKLFGDNTLFTLDVALPIVHGTNCEDGSLQGFFEVLRLPYVGCDVLSSAVGMDKIVMKQILADQNLPIVPYISFDKIQWGTNQIPLVEKIADAFGFPCMVKPSNLGSSIGISKAENKTELIEAIDLALSFARRIIVEKAISPLREINCSVIGDYEKSTVSVCEEPISTDKILSYADKYAQKNRTKGMASLKRKIPADITAEQSKKIRSLAREAFLAIGASGVVRIDFLMDSDNDDIYINEINTIPGSLAFYLWEPKDVSYKQMLEMLIKLALKRERENKNLIYTYDSNVFKNGNFKSNGKK